MYVLYCLAAMFRPRTRQPFLVIGISWQCSFLLQLKFLAFSCSQCSNFRSAFEFYSRKNELLLTGCVNIVIFTLITWNTFKVMWHCFREKAKKPKYLTQLKLNSTCRFVFPFIQACCVELFCSLQSKLFCVQAK